MKPGNACSSISPSAETPGAAHRRNTISIPHSLSEHKLAQWNRNLIYWIEPLELVSCSHPAISFLSPVGRQQRGLSPDPRGATSCWARWRGWPRDMVPGASFSCVHHRLLPWCTVTCVPEKLDDLPPGSGVQQTPLLGFTQKADPPPIPAAARRPPLGKIPSFLPAAKGPLGEGALPVGPAPFGIGLIEGLDRHPGGRIDQATVIQKAGQDVHFALIVGRRLLHLGGDAQALPLPGQAAAQRPGQDAGRGVFPGEWGFPGSGIEPGERMVDALPAICQDSLTFSSSPCTIWPNPQRTIR
jgi:hypothetical protein